jgi:uncharacterized membrane protein YfcA
MNLKVILILSVFAYAKNSCESDGDCSEVSTCRNNLCVHKGVLPLTTTEYASTIVMVITAVLANAGGIGGSSVAISLMLFSFKFDAHSSVALTQVFVFAGATISTGLKLRDRHPTKDRPIIYYDALIQIVSPMLTGVSIGVILSPSFPSWLIIFLVTVIAAFLLWGVLKKTIQTSKKTNRAPRTYSYARKMEYTKIPGEGNEPSILRTYSINNTEDDQTSSSQNNEVYEALNEIFITQNNSDYPSNLYSIPVQNHQDCLRLDLVPTPMMAQRLDRLHEQEREVPWTAVSYFTVLSVASIAFSMMKQGSPSIVGITSCSKEFFGLIAAYVCFMLSMNAFAAFYLVRKTEVCKKLKYSFDEGDIQWNYSKCTQVSLASICLGTVSGLLGIGGTNLVGPLLVMLGVRPEISTISASFAILLSSGIASAQYFVSGAFDITYAVLFLAISSAGSIIGVLFLRKYIIKTEKVPLVLFCLSITLAVSLITIPGVGIMTAIEESHQGTFRAGFSSIC